MIGTMIVQESGNFSQFDVLFATILTLGKAVQPTGFTKPSKVNYRGMVCMRL
jgi:hypothetical protein